MPFQHQSLEQILTNRTLWGPEFSSALATLPAFARVGEHLVVVFPDRVLGQQKHARREEAGPRAARFAEELKATEKFVPINPRMQELLRPKRVPLKTEIMHLPDDRSLRIGVLAPSPVFLRPGLTMATVQKELGKAEKITTEVLDDGTERRPVILTLHHYADSSVIFAESDVNPYAGSVDRVFLDAPRVSAAMFKEAK
jgi:hypothetical protein